MFTLDTADLLCTVLYMDQLAYIEKLVQQRSDAERMLDAVMNELRVNVIAAIRSGELSELGAHRLTGLSRTTIREWLGKT